MNSYEIRETFLKFFEVRGHRRVSSSPLVPAQDPTLLFTNAGMNQFKNVFLGLESRPYKRATTCQKCMRAGGKHNDLDNVGLTPRHHTFFEMLGNFSFGDYFKEQAILWAWELVTGAFAIPNERLWVTVFKDDDEAFQIWDRSVGLSEDRIIRLGEKDNFWAMGDTGPCGPCSEIYYDIGPETGCGRANCIPGCECGRFLEFWNLVFMQYNRDPEGRLEPLPHPSIDTGMGLERITAILQGVYDNFHTDLFIPLIEVICQELGAEYPTGETTDIAIRVIADHARAIAFLLSEGVLPSNEGRGYVLRKIIRRALRYGKFAGRHEPYLFKVALYGIDVMKNVYPELDMGRELVRSGCYAEEQRFFRVIETGLMKLEELMEHHLDSKILPGGEVFRLYDTFGLPWDMVEEIAHERGFALDRAGFDSEMMMQRERARRSWKGGDAVAGQEIYEDLSRRYTVQFHGYDHLRWEGAHVLALLNENKKPVPSLEIGQRGEMILDHTVFYGESGGQVGDQGIIRSARATAHVLDTRIYFHNIIVHHIEVRDGVIVEGDEVSMEVPAERRWATMRHHTGTHLLHAALREVLGLHVKQAGSLVAPDRLRFDFTHFHALHRSEIEEIERRVNAKIMENAPVQVHSMSLDDALDSGALAFFGDKYGERVRVIEVAEFSKELCGGTHVRYTGDIGLFQIVKESSVAAGVRRIEALCGDRAVAALQAMRSTVNDAARILKTSEGDLVRRLEETLRGYRELQKTYANLRRTRLGETQNELFTVHLDLSVCTLVARVFEDMPMEDLRTLADNLRNSGKTIAVLGSRRDGKALLIIAVPQSLTRCVPADELVRHVVPLIGGGGGGRPDFAQAGGNRPDSLVDAVREAVKEVQTRLATEQTPV